MIKYYYINDNSNVCYTYEYSLASNCIQNIKIVNNLKIREPYDMYDNCSQNTCSRVCEMVIKMVVVVGMVVECDGEVAMN